MIIKKIILISLCFLIVSCGFKPVYTKKENFNIAINEMELKGDKKVNRRIVSALNFSKQNSKDPGYDIEIFSYKSIKTIAKNEMGDASIYRMTIMLDITVKKGDEIFKSKKFTKNFTYNTLVQKFDLMRYESTIETNLIEKIIEEIKIYLNT